MTDLINETAINLVDYIYAPDAGVNPDTGEDLSEQFSPSSKTGASPPTTGASR